MIIVIIIINIIMCVSILSEIFSPTMVNIDLQSSEIEKVGLRIEMLETQDERLELKLKYNIVSKRY